jgi:transcriptional regulator PpsR
VALIVDGQGIIRDVATGSEELPEAWIDGLVGRPWVETVSIDSREKVTSLLREAGTHHGPRWRHVNHAWESNHEVPVLYTAVPIDNSGRVAAVGRDLRPLSTLQQRLIEAQQSIERDYARLRQAEMRYRLLFEMTSEAVLIVEAASNKIVEANPAAATLMGSDLKKMIGRGFPIGFEATGTQGIQQLLARARSNVRGEEVQARRADTGEVLQVAASMFRQDGVSYFLVRMTPLDAERTEVTPAINARALDVLSAAPDGFVVTDLKGDVLMANGAFLDLIDMGSEEQACGQSLGRWLGRFGNELNVMLSSLREHGSLRFFATTLRSEHGAREEVELSAVSVPDGEEPCCGFIVRSASRRPATQGHQNGHKDMPRSVEQLTELVGRVPLREIVRESTEVIERMCIEAALELTGNNRASAAEMLGLSRQSLYVKLRRYGLLDMAADGDV